MDYQNKEEQPPAINMKGRIKCICGAIRNEERIDCPVCYTIELGEKTKAAKFKASQANKRCKMKKHVRIRS
jgi:hypothetical protein